MENSELDYELCYLKLIIILIEKVVFNFFRGCFVF